jgi:hypothetical protein
MVWTPGCLSLCIFVVAALDWTADKLTEAGPYAVEYLQAFTGRWGPIGRNRSRLVQLQASSGYFKETIP